MPPVQKRQEKKPWKQQRGPDFDDPFDPSNSMKDFKKRRGDEEEEAVVPVPSAAIEQKP